MFKKLKKEITTNAKVEKLNKNELSNVIGGDDSGSGTTTPTPDDTKGGGKMVTTWNIMTNTK